MRARHLIPLVLLPVVVIACGDDDDDDEDDGDSAAAAVTAPAASIGAPEDTKQIIEVVATDYRFDGLPASAPVGTQFALQNDSTKEVHEMVIYRIPDEVKETIGQIVALPEDEQEALVGDNEPTAVIVALPGEAGKPVLGDGVIDEPGRYGVLCFIPVGADPAVVAAAMDAPPGSEPAEQPPLGDGPPHIMEGMYAEIMIEEA